MVNSPGYELVNPGVLDPDTGIYSPGYELVNPGVLDPDTGIFTWL